MAKILVLARSGFGKSSSLIGIPELGIEGLNPKETYLFSVVNKPLPRRGSKKLYVPVPMQGVTAQNLGQHITKGNRIISDDMSIVSAGLSILIEGYGKHPYKNIVIDDTNYLQQNFYMKDALKGGWDTPKRIGYGMHTIFKQVDAVPEDGMNIIVMAHFESYRDKDEGTMVYKYKSTGNMVDEYILPEGLFESTLFGKDEWNEREKKSYRYFVTNNDGKYPAKTPFGMFNDLYIPNDLGYVVKEAEKYFNGEE